MFGELRDDYMHLHKWKLDKPHDRWHIGDGVNNLFRYQRVKCGKIKYFSYLPGEKKDCLGRFVKS